MFFSKRIFSPFRIIKFLFFFFLALALALIVYLMAGDGEFNSDIDFGVSFSQVSAEQMEIDWRKAYSSILDDLGVKKFRLIAYWQKIETNKGEYVFDDLDWQINEAEKRGAEVVLAVGSKLPGFTGCYLPNWTKDLNNDEKKENALLFLKEVIKRYNSKSIIKAWQIEDDPFQRFSEECLGMDEEFLNKEISLVNEFDFSDKPIILTTNGEIGSWFKLGVLTNNLGISIDRNNWSPYLGYFKYHIKPNFYQKRISLTKRFVDLDNVVVIGLQAEPNSHKPVNEISLLEAERSMNLDIFRDTMHYIKRTGFDEVYIRGAEWWYYLRSEGNDSFWVEAKKIWSE